jgi:hypothetical protein
MGANPRISLTVSEFPIPAPNLEALVTDQLRSLCANPVEILNSVSGDESDAPTQKRLRDV